MMKLIAIKAFRAEVKQLENQRNLILNTTAELQILIWTQDSKYIYSYVFCLVKKWCRHEESQEMVHM